MNGFKNFVRCWLLPSGIVYFLSIWVAGAIRGRHFSTVTKFRRGHDKLFVLATGPSFKEDYPKYRDEMSESDTMALNFFAHSPLFAEIRPTSYLLVDPAFYADFDVLEREGKGDLGQRIETLIEILVNSVDWPMTLIMPDLAKGSELLRRVAVNKNITICHYNSRLGMRWTTRCEMWLMKHQMIAPPAQTVANMAVGLGIVLGYSEVWLLGADTSMHTMMRVDQKTNEFYLENEHFYGGNREAVKKSRTLRNPVTVASWLSSISEMFYGYERIRAFADYCGVRVVNASSFSWIDSLERA